jgi:hypothetical protein
MFSSRASAPAARSGGQSRPLMGVDTVDAGNHRDVHRLLAPSISATYRSELFALEMEVVVVELVQVHAIGFRFLEDVFLLDSRSPPRRWI